MYIYVMYTHLHVYADQYERNEDYYVIITQLSTITVSPTCSVNDLYCILARDKEGVRKSTYVRTYIYIYIYIYIC